jgi:hypothetical protein
MGDRIQEDMMKIAKPDAGDIEAASELVTIP